MPEPNWDRTLALHTAQATDTQALLGPLFQLARTGDNAGLLAALSSIQQDAGLSAPARDYLIFSFLLGLSDMEVNSVDPQVLEYLFLYEVQTLVAHDDFAAVGVPLFNTRAAAAGVRHSWDWQLARDRAGLLIQTSSQQWVSSYLAASQIERRGMLDAMNLASISQLQELGWSALARLDEHADLTLIAAQAGLKTDDFALFQQAIIHGSGPGLPRILQTAASQLEADEAMELLGNSIRLSSASNAALVIAQLAPNHLGEPGVRELVFSTLSNQNLGAAASMVLGASSDPGIQRRLNEIAAGKDSLAQQRASLAIKTRQSDPREAR